MKRTVCTFANYPISKGFERYRNEAESLHLFDEILTYSEKQLDKAFVKKWGKYMHPYARGYGYWVWKPYFILDALNRLEDGDVLLYTDLGCFFNPEGRKRLLEYYDIIDKSESGMLGVRSQENSYNGMPEVLRFENEWTKGDIFDYFGVRNDRSYTHTTQFESTVIFFKKSPKAMQFVRDWYQAYVDNYDLATDEPSKSPNFPEFTENRHDQSIYSILAKKYHIAEISTNEICPASGKFDNEELKDYPIWAKRELYYPSKWHYVNRYKLRRAYRVWWHFKYFFINLV